MIHTTAGGVVFGPSGKVIVVNQNNDSWSLPKGHIDEGETAEEAAIREIHEESGVHVTIIQTLGAYTRPTIGYGGIGDAPNQIKHITIFVCVTSETNLEPIDPHHPEARWVELDEVEALLTHKKDKQFVADNLVQLKKFLASFDISTLQ